MSLTPLILIVDDEPQNLQVLKSILEPRYRLAFARSGKEALSRVAQQVPDLILLDVMMPELDGFEVCRRLKSDPQVAAVPVIFVTALRSVDDEKEGFDAGAVDYIAKPVSAPTVLARVQTHLSLVRVEQLEETRLLIIQRLGRAAEYRDNETGLHVIRMSHYSRLLALACGWSEDDSNLLFQAAPMHDIGKIGTPDQVLLKPGPLDKEEWKIMCQHAEIGANIIGHHKSSLLEMAYDVALTHHEKWDGRGYPRGLSNEEIPLAGRIVAVADVFDALTSVRPYKKAWTVEEAIQHLKDNAGTHFDPSLIPLFLEDTTFKKVLEVREKWAEKTDGNQP